MMFRCAVSGDTADIRANVRFAQPFRFTGRFSAGVPLRLTFRVLGATRAGDVEALLIEPVKLEAVR